MTKTQTIKLIEQVKKYHEMQMERVKMLIGGKDVDELTPLEKTECEFGKTFYENSEFLKEILGSLFYDKIEVLHESWHREYRKIYDILSPNKNKSFLSKLLNTRTTQMDIDKAKMYYVDLSGITKELLQIIAASHRRIQALSESKFK